MGGIVGVAMVTMSDNPSLLVPSNSNANLWLPLGTRDRKPILVCLNTQASICSVLSGNT